ncbi:MAG TPA: hypothetical protein VF781_04745 [Solirubrobacteraceae bacterium]
MRRARVIVLVVVGVALFLVISALLARVLSVGGAEDSAITALVRAEARGDRAAVQAAITGCARRPACQARAASVAATLKRAGTVQIVQIQPSAGFSLGATTGTARVVWLAGGSLPRVQCVRVRRAGGVLAGYRVQLLEVSARIRTNADCPAHY